MKKLLCFLILLFQIPAFAGVGIISDLDDTIKITHVASPVAATVNGVFRKRVFTGMPEFLREAKSYASELHIITASPGLISKSVHRTLDSNSIVYDSVAFKNPFKKEDKISYKLRKIKEILDRSPHDFILLGDDVDKDPEIFKKVQELFPNRILRSYIHVVRNRQLPGGSVTYFTAADLALRETLEGRFSLQSAEEILDHLLKSSSFERVIPRFAHCPRERTTWDWQLETVLSPKAQKLIDALVRYCRRE